MASGCMTSAGVMNYDFIEQAPYAPNENIVYSGVRIPNFYQIDSNLSKNFHPTERFTVQLRLEGFNMVNHPTFQRTMTPTRAIRRSEPSFGRTASPTCRVRSSSPSRCCGNFRARA